MTTAPIVLPPVANPLHLFKEVLDTLDEGVVIVDKTFHITYLNASAQNVSKAAYGFEYLVGDSVVEGLPKGRHKEVIGILNRVLNGETVNYEVEVPQSTREAQWLQCTDKPLYGEDGYVHSIIVRFSNITVQKQLAAAEVRQRELQEQSLQNRLLFEEFMQNAPLIGWITDATGINQYMNPAFEAQQGLSAADRGKSIYEMLPTQLAVDWHLHNLRVLRDKQLHETTERLEDAKGVEHCYKIYRFPIQHNGCTMVAAWGVDITEQASLEGQLKRHLEQYYYIIEATSDAIYDWKLGNDQLSRGNNFATLFGYVEQMVTADENYELIHGSDRHRIQNSHALALADPLSLGWALEYRYRCADGSYKQVLDRATIIWENGKAVRVLGALQDVTEQRELHKRLMDAEKGKKREIVRSIIEAQEKERRKLSVELHDNVNQMLSSCKLLLEVACDGGANALELTRKSFKGVSQVIQEIRKISHELNPSALEDVGLVDAITEMLGIINSTDKIFIDFQQTGLADAAALSKEDNVAIYRIIQEQVNNILKHSHASSASVVVSKESNSIRLQIKDNGIGFDVAKAKKGHGIRNIQSRVDYYGGSLHIHSTQEEGSCLDIVLRLEAA